MADISVCTRADIPLAKASVAGDGNANAALTLTSLRADGEWTIAANTISYAGTPDRIRFDAMAFYDAVNNNGLARISPHLQLVKNGTTVVAESGTGYQRHTGNHNDSSNTIAWTDHNPGANPSYQLLAKQGATQNDVLNVTIGHISAEALR